MDRLDFLRGAHCGICHPVFAVTPVSVTDDRSFCVQTSSRTRLRFQTLQPPPSDEAVVPHFSPSGGRERGTLGRRSLPGP